MNLEQISEDYEGVAREIFGPLRSSVEDVATAMVTCVRQGGKVMFCGNGGSAADAQHFAGEFVNRFLKERPAFAGLALTTDTSVMTAVGNDYNFVAICIDCCRATFKIRHPAVVNFLDFEQARERPALIGERKHPATFDVVLCGNRRCCK